MGKYYQAILGDKSPCKICAVRVMCEKSFTNKKGGGCPELKEALQEALREDNEDKN